MKTTYQAPTLISWGSLQQMTQKSGPSITDGMMGGSHTALLPDVPYCPDPFSGGSHLIVCWNI